jgi:hypothetical protein
MSEAHTSGCACGAIRYESGNAAALGAADRLCLAAAPTFAIMALLTGVLGGGPPDMRCSAAQDVSPLSGMVPMYLYGPPCWLGRSGPKRRAPPIARPWRSNRTPQDGAGWNARQRCSSPP